jgi:hypothetical protein
MLLYALLVKNKAMDWTSKLIKGNESTLAIHHIFPRGFLEDQPEDQRIDEPEKINSLANLTFINRSHNSAKGEKPPEEYLGGLPPESLSQHFIPTDKRLWKIEKYETFLKERAKLIWEAIERLL